MKNQWIVNIKAYTIVPGIFVAYGGGYFGAYVIFAIGLCLVLLGCWSWTYTKNRHWAFMLWGLLAPIGLLGIGLLKDKSGTDDSTK